MNTGSESVWEQHIFGCFFLGNQQVQLIIDLQEAERFESCCFLRILWHNTTLTLTLLLRMTILENFVFQPELVSSFVWKGSRGARREVVWNTDVTMSLQGHHTVICAKG